MQRYSPWILLSRLRANCTASLRWVMLSFYAPAAGLKGDSLDARLRIDRTYLDNPGNEYYLVRYVSENQLSGQNTLEHPAKAYAKALSNEPPACPVQSRSISPTGVIKMVLIEDKVAAGKHPCARLQHRP